MPARALRRCRGMRSTCARRAPPRRPAHLRPAARDYAQDAAARDARAVRRDGGRVQDVSARGERRPAAGRAEPRHLFRCFKSVAGTRAQHTPSQR
eukprot:3905158-Prymnesium_polylepis.1